MWRRLGKDDSKYPVKEINSLKQKKSKLTNAKSMLRQAMKLI